MIGGDCVSGRILNSFKQISFFLCVCVLFCMLIIYLPRVLQARSTVRQNDGGQSCSKPAQSVVSVILSLSLNIVPSLQGWPNHFLSCCWIIKKIHKRAAVHQISWIEKKGVPCRYQAALWMSESVHCQLVRATEHQSKGVFSHEPCGVGHTVSHQTLEGC